LHDACAAGQRINSLAFDRRPRLAAALEDAVCIDIGILVHCRESGEQVIGVWVVDALLRTSRGGWDTGLFCLLGEANSGNEFASKSGHQFVEVTRPKRLDRVVGVVAGY
jgi:hypothetical protein